MAELLMPTAQVSELAISHSCDKPFISQDLALRTHTVAKHNQECMNSILDSIKNAGNFIQNRDASVSKCDLQTHHIVSDVLSIPIVGIVASLQYGR